MALKYMAKLKACPDQPCPSDKFQPGSIQALRFMHKPATERDFLPPAELPDYDGAGHCGSYALSFFKNITCARKRYLSLAERIDVLAKLGDHIGEISLLPSDGIMSSPDKRGHVNLHPDASASFADRVTTYHTTPQPPVSIAPAATSSFGKKSGVGGGS